MKKIKNSHKKSFIKKIFIKVCRFLGYEIIDQSNYDVPTMGKALDASLSVPGKKSINIPLGETEITSKIKSIKILFRSCTSELIMDQSKQRLFNKKKSEYTFRSLNSILKSLEFAQKKFKNVDFEIIVTDSNSPNNDVDKLKSILKNFNIKNRLQIINLSDFKNEIRGEYSEAKMSNMANFYNSLLIAKKENSDLFYFVEDDYIHSLETITEMLFFYEKFSSIFNTKPVLLPSDYPYLYTKNNKTKIYLGENRHWRLVDESLVTFLMDKDLILQNFNNLKTMGIKWEDPWEKPLHEIYNKHPCLSPIPSLAYHCANINSVFGLSPNIKWKSVWDENEIN